MVRLEASCSSGRADKTSLSSSLRLNEQIGAALTDRSPSCTDYMLQIMRTNKLKFDTQKAWALSGVTELISQM